MRITVHNDSVLFLFVPYIVLRPCVCVECTGDLFTHILAKLKKAISTAKCAATPSCC